MLFLQISKLRHGRLSHFPRWNQSSLCSQRLHALHAVPSPHQPTRAFLHPLISRLVLPRAIFHWLEFSPTTRHIFSWAFPRSTTPSSPPVTACTNTEYHLHSNWVSPWVCAGRSSLGVNWSLSIVSVPCIRVSRQHTLGKCLLAEQNTDLIRIPFS